MGRCHPVRILSAGLLILIILIGGTLAYFYDDDSVSTDTEIRKKENLEVHLMEPLWESDDQGLGLVPGDVVPADPTIINEEDPVYMRVVMILYDSTTRERITGPRAEQIRSLLYYAPADTSINEDSFAYDAKRSSTEEGYFCYNYIRSHGVLKTGEQAVLYDRVKIPVDWKQQDTEAAGGFIIHMQGEAVHAENMKEEGITDTEEIFELLHRNSEITGGTVYE